MHAKSFRLLINYMIQFGLVATLKLLYTEVSAIPSAIQGSNVKALPELQFSIDKAEFLLSATRWR